MAAPFLVKRRAGWYLRIRIPSPLVPLFGTHLTRSLKTRDYQLARQRAIMAAARLTIAGVEGRMAVSEDDFRITEEHLQRRRRQRLWADIGEFDDPMASVVPTAPAVAPSEPTLADIAHARLEGFKEALSLLSPKLEAAPPTPSSSPGSPSPEEGLRPEAEVEWTGLVDRFFLARPSIGESAQVSHRQAFKEFADLIGERAVKAVGKGDVARYVEWLEERTDGRRGRARLSRETIVKKLQHLRGFFDWAVEKAYAHANPATGVRPRSKTREEKENDETRRALTVAELDYIFSSPLFLGCKSLRHRSKPGSILARDEKFWFFLVMLFTGGRVKELAQAPSALLDLGGVRCLDLRTAGTKARASARVVPIGADLANLGFVAWADAKARAGETLLFAGGAASANWSKWTNRYFDDLGITDDLVTTYSLRHNFRQMLRAAALGDELMDKVFGHKHGQDSKNETGKRYGRALSPQEARLVVDRVRSPISVAHLQQRASARI